MSEPHRVQLRAERRGDDWRNLWVYLDGEGGLHVEGQDLGPGTAPVSSDGEYEWYQSIAAADVPRLVELLGGAPDDNVVDVLAANYTGDQSYEFERRLRESDIVVALHVWSG